MLTSDATTRSLNTGEKSSAPAPQERSAIEIVRPASPPQDQTILCFASNYFFDPTSKHHVMRELAKTRHVLWVNWHASRRPSLNRRDLRGIVHKLKQIGRGVTKVSDRLWVMTPFVLPLPSSRLARRINRFLVALQLRWVLRRLPAQRQLWSFTPDVADLLGKFGEKERVYYCVDEFSAFPGYDVETIRGLEKRMCESSDLVITTSGRLYETKRPLNPETTIYVPHGVLYERFAQAASPDYPEADDIRHLPRPRVGFFGLLHEWWDLDLMAEIAKRKPEWSFVFVGQADCDISRFQDVPNMHFVGRRAHEDLPAYCRSFDVAVIPHKLNELTRSMNPIKLLEYLAAGLPVVSSPLPEAAAYSPDVCCAQGVDEWVAALTAAIGDRNITSDRRRSRLASGEDWSVRVATILDALEESQHKRLPVPVQTANDFPPRTT